MSAPNFEEKRNGEFDREGVSEHFKSPRHVALFRELVTGQGIRPYLPFNKQATLAKALVELAKKTEAELCGPFIRHNVYSAILDVRIKKRKLDAEELADKSAKVGASRCANIMTSLQDMLEKCSKLQSILSSSKRGSQWWSIPVPSL